MWDEVVASPVSTPTKKKKDVSVTINGVDWTNRSGGVVNKEEDEECKSLFFFTKGVSGKNEGGSEGERKRTTSTGSDTLDSVLEANNVDIDARVLSALRDDRVVNNKALVPIIASLQTLVNQEQDRRLAALESMQELHTQLLNACERLCVPIESFLSFKNFPANASLYVKRDLLMERVASVDLVVKAREERLDGLKEAVEDVRKGLEDLEEDEFGGTMPDNLAATTIEAWVQTLYALEEEKASRQSQIAKACAKIHKLSTLLNKFPNATDQEKNLSLFLQTPLPAQYEDASLPALPSALSGALTSQIHHSNAYTQILYEQHYKTLLQSNESVVNSTAISISLTRSCIQWLRDLELGLDGELQSKRDLCKKLVKEIQMCFEQLEEEEMAGLDVDDLSREDEYAALADSLRERWKKKMQEVVVRLLVDLTILWDKCHITPEERKEFTMQFGDNLFSPLTVETITMELFLLQERFDLEHPLYTLIEQRAALLAKMVDFEKSASDPKRLFRSSFQLNEEERFRKTCVPSLIKLEDVLKSRCRSFEEEHERHFVFRGSRFLDTLEKEMSERFLNEALFIFDTTSMAQTRGSAVTPGKTRRPSAHVGGGASGGRDSPKLVQAASNSAATPGGKKGIHKSASLSGIGGM
ncbi:UNVERIFIED_CONTAM: carboxypeptidase C prc1, partial [Siphonaria sp. JEL0065]